MDTLIALGIVVGIILVFYVAPYWLYKGFNGESSNSAVWKLIKGFLIGISFALIGAIAILIYYGLIRLILGLVIPPLGSGSAKEYGIVALCFFSLYMIYAIYNTLYTIVILIKYPGFKEYYLNNNSPFNNGKNDLHDYKEKKKGWGIINKVLPRKQTRLIYSYFYDVLGLDVSASTDEIKKAYREKAQQYHPDKFFNASEQEGKLAEKKFREIKDAYEHIIKHKKEGGLD